MSVKKVIKRDGSSVDFDLQKIVVAIGKANAAVAAEQRLEDSQILAIAR